MATVDSFKFLQVEIIRNLNSLNDLLAFYGAWNLVKNLIKSIKFLNTLCPLTKKIDIRNFGKYAVISTIENELGKEIAIYLASQNLNLIVITDSKTKDVQEFLNKLSFEFEIEILTLDSITFDKCLNEIHKTNNMIKPFESDKKIDGDFENVMSIEEKTFEKILQKDIGILINCNDHTLIRWDKFSNSSIEEINKLINANVLLPIKIHRLFLKEFVKRERGLIFNVSSLVGIHPCPNLFLHSMTECFIDQLSNSINYDCNKSNKILFKTLILTHLTSHLFRPFETNYKIIQSDDINNKYKKYLISSLKKKLINLILPEKKKFIMKLFQSDYSSSTTGHWLFGLEYFLNENFFQFVPNFVIKYFFTLIH